MKISNLEITHFRNLEINSLQPGPLINLFYGDNGSGKTSILEAIHYLGLGRSFRTRNINRIIQHCADRFSIVCQLADNNGLSLPIGIERKKSSFNLQVKVAGNNASSLVELAQKLPLQLINADSHLLLTSGPLIRRQFLDWGVFHVEPTFYHYWQRANRIIKQRNANLKAAVSYQEINVWDQELQECATRLHTMRLNYSQMLSPIILDLLNLLLGSHDCSLDYSPGWNTQIELKECLQGAFSRDKQLGYTQQGPHRADFLLKAESVPAQEILSQGQQKLATYAMRLAQGILLKNQTNKSCLYLIDDLPSELDSNKRAITSDLIKQLKMQVFVTGIERENLENLKDSSTKGFHVKQGKIMDVF
jgi:DNA replication and repair protein RecF